MDSINGDRTAGRVAICGAIFAGFAYVGFAVFKTAVYRKQDDEEPTTEATETNGQAVAVLDKPDELRVCIRRLSSSSCQTDPFLGNMDVTAMAAGMVLRPMSVQERIKQLNHQSRRIDGAVAAMALRSSATSFRARSLQCSPWNSPRILSPVDVQHMLSRSVENLSMTESGQTSRTNSLCRRRTTLGACRNRSPAPALSPRPRSVSRELSPSCSGLHRLAGDSGTGGLASTPRSSSRPGSACSSRATSELNLAACGLGSGLSAGGGGGGYEPSPFENDDAGTVIATSSAVGSVVTEVHILLRDSEETLRRRLDELYNKGRVLSTNEVRALVSLLHTNDYDLLQRALTTVANCAAFTINQDYLRDAGCLTVLGQMLYNPQLPISVASSVVQAMGNLALNVENQKQLKNYIPVLLELADLTEAYPDNLRLLSLICLTNLAVCEHTHDCYVGSIHRLYQLLDLGGAPEQLQASRLLVNLASNCQMVPFMLAAKVKAPERLLDLLSLKTNEELLLRLVTLLSHLTITARRDAIGPADLPVDGKAASPETMLALIYGLNTAERLRNKVFVLTKSRQPEVRNYAKAVHDCLKQPTE